MSVSPQPISLVAERAVRLLRRAGRSLDSRHLARELLATRTDSEAAARTLLEAAFNGDPRLSYDDGGWSATGTPAPSTGQVDLFAPEPPAEPAAEPDRALVILRGGVNSETRRYELTGISAIRLQSDEVVGACGGDTIPGAAGNRLRRAVSQTLDGAVPVVHDAPGSLRALQEWLQEPISHPISLRKLGQRRLDLPARHDLSEFIAELNISWREVDDPLEQADTLDTCLRALLRDGETLHQLRADLAGGSPPIDWSRFAFDREYLRSIPRTPGTYQFFDARGNLLYVGQSKDLNRRLNSYFHEGGTRTKRVQKLIDELHRIEYQHRGSALEATLKEAELIARRKPTANVQRRIEPKQGRARRLRSILILEPAEAPAVLRAYMIRAGRFIDKVEIGPRGGGLTKVKRLLEHHFFHGAAGPTTIAGPDLDVEIVVRWLAANRDNVVAFDPTDLPSSEEVIERLRWFLTQGGPFDGDGSPVFTR